MPALRGRGVSGAASTRLAHALADEGCRRILAGVLMENRAGKRAYEKAGYRRVGRIGYVGLGPWRRAFKQLVGRLLGMVTIARKVPIEPGKKYRPNVLPPHE